MAKDLVALAACRTISGVIETLVTHRRPSLGIRAVTCDFVEHPGHDPGVRTDAVRRLSRLSDDYSAGLVVFDWEGSGGEARTANELAAEIREGLPRSGWGARAEVICIDPEVESWVWANSPHVDEALGCEPGEARLLVEMMGDALDETTGKPLRPKEAMQAVLRSKGRPFSAAIHRRLAEKVTLDRCTDPASVRLREFLQRHFPAE